jgi:hypothetical protein
MKFTPEVEESPHFEAEVVSGTNKRRERKTRGRKCNSTGKDTVLARLYKSAVEKEEVKYKHGPVKVLVRDGKEISSTVEGT